MLRLRKELERLRVRLKELDTAYHTAGQPLVSDSEYDALQAHVRTLERRVGDAQAGTVGASPRGVGVAHARPMLSLERARDAEQLRRFHKSVLKASGAAPVSYVVERKFDGLAAAVRCDSAGRVVQILTRGDGAAGDDVTEAGQRFLDARSLRIDVTRLPAAVRGAPFELRGEVLLPARLAVELSPRGSATARNVAAGLLMRRELDSADAPRAVLQFRCFGFVGGSESVWRLQSEMNAALRDAGLATCDVATVGDVEAVERLWRDEGERLRRESEFDMDGLVVKVDSTAVQAAMGERTRSPRWAVALKFEAERAATSVLDVRLQIGRFGTVTPVASVAPVTLGGASLARASLHHLGRAYALGLFPFERAGAAVLLERGGDVIPRVVGRVDGVPLRAPLDADCNAELAALAPTCPCARRAPLVAHAPNQWRCSAEAACEPRQLARRLHLCRTLELENLAEGVLEQLAALGVVRCDADLLRLAALRSRLPTPLPAGWGERKWTRLAAQIDARLAARSLELRRVAETEAEWRAPAAGDAHAGVLPLWRAVVALGAEHVGPAAARGVAQRFGSLAALVGVDAAQLAECDGVGPVAAAELHGKLKELCATVDGRDLLYTLDLISGKPERSGEK